MSHGPPPFSQRTAGEPSRSPPEVVRASKHGTRESTSLLRSSLHRRPFEGRCGPLKYFNEQICLLHLFREARIGIIADDPVTLRPVVTNQARAIDDKVV